MLNRARGLLPVCLALAVWLSAVSHAEEAPAAAPAATAGTSDASSPNEEPAALTGREIYSRVLANRFRSFRQASSLRSGDRSGRVQETRLKMMFMDFRNVEAQASRGVLSKTIVQYTYPFDLRHAGYLMIQNDRRANDQFVYLPAQRRTTRVNLRGNAVFGTDFSFEDVIPRELENATYERLADEVLGDQSVFVVEAKPIGEVDSEYSKFSFYVDNTRFVPLRTRYWDQAGVEIKELRIARQDIRRFGDVHIPMKLTMRHLLLESHTTLRISDLEPNVTFPASAFEVRRLETH